MSPGTALKVGRDGPGVWAQLGDGPRQGPYGGPLQLSPDASALMLDLRAGERPLAYQGALEVGATPGGDRVGVVNVLGLDEYLAGVVPREMPPSFGLEASQVQAVAARGFALARIARGTHRAFGADVCSDVDCQAFGGASAEHPLTSAAIASTRGQILLANGRLVETLYSSSCGGHTESPSALFGGSESGSTSVADGELPGDADLSSERGAAAFWSRAWTSHCAEAPRYRWRVTWSDRQLADTLTSGLRRLSGVARGSGSLSAHDVVASIRHVSVARRSTSGRASALHVEASNGIWSVERDWNIRQLLRTPEGQPLSSSALVLEAEHTPDGLVRTLTAIGGGSGHGAGMCQWGARELARRGLRYDAILAHYYPGTELSSIAG